MVNTMGRTSEHKKGWGQLGREYFWMAHDSDSSRQWMCIYAHRMHVAPVIIIIIIILMTIVADRKWWLVKHDCKICVGAVAVGTPQTHTHTQLMASKNWRWRWYLLTVWIYTLRAANNRTNRIKRRWSGAMYSVAGPSWFTIAKSNENNKFCGEKITRNSRRKLFIIIETMWDELEWESIE